MLLTPHPLSQTVTPLEHDVLYNMIVIYLKLLYSFILTKSSPFIPFKDEILVTNAHFFS